VLIPQAFKPELLRLLNELPEEAWTHNLWRQTLYKELEAGRCTEDEVSAFERSAECSTGSPRASATRA
jgi:hypothetical protein